MDCSEELIPGTNIHKPRGRGDYETDEEYVDFLRQYYEKVFPNNSYLENLMQYINHSHITIYDYYVSVADHYRNHDEDNLPAFEHNNPFITDIDLQNLIQSDDNRMPLFFAGSLSKVVERNLSQRQMIENQIVFEDPVEKYNEEVGYRIQYV